MGKPDYSCDINLQDFEEYRSEWTGMKAVAIDDVLDIKFNTNIEELSKWMDVVISKGATKIHIHDDLYEGKTGRYLTAYKLVPMTEEELGAKKIRTVQLTYDPQV